MEWCLFMPVHWTNEFFICWNCQMRGRFSLDLALEIKPNFQIFSSTFLFQMHANQSIVDALWLIRYRFRTSTTKLMCRLWAHCEKSTDVQWKNVAIPKRKWSSAIMFWRLFYLLWEIGIVVRVVLSIYR